MHNINELVGIIKGINFDGIINKKEILYLKSWVDKNRNLSHDDKQLELIKLVDAVIADNVITKDEHEALLTCAEKMKMVVYDGSAKIYELSGIIEGIICDGVINEHEVYHLKVWMETNKDFVRTNEFSKELYDVVEEILVDGIVTEEEQNMLLETLSTKIKGVQIATKLNYLRKLVRERRNIGVDLIDILDKDDVIYKIHKDAEIQLKATLNSYTGSFSGDVEIVFISLVLIAMLKYDGNYYRYVEEVYKEIYKSYPEQKIEGIIRSILNRYRTDEEIKTTRTRIINVVLTNAIVPSCYLAAFFEFIYDIYKLNFEYSLPENLYAEFKFVYEGLSANMLLDGDDIQVNVTKKTYKLIRSTKLLIASNKNIESVINISIIVVKLIDKGIWQNGLKIYNPYLEAGFKGWQLTLKHQTKISRACELKTEPYSRWEPKYILQDNDVYILPPIHKVQAKYFYKDIKILVKNGDKNIYINCEPDIREIIGGYRVMPQAIKLIEVFGKIAYKLIAGNDTIYDSEDKLYRDIIVFNLDGKEIRNNSDYSGLATFCYKKSNDKLQAFYNTENYQLASREVKTGDAYMVDDTVFNFSFLTKPGIFGECFDNHYLLDEATGKKLSVYKKIKLIVFEHDSTMGFFQIAINGQPHMLNKFKYTVIERNGINKYTVELAIDTPGIYFIAVYLLFEGIQKKLITFNFAIDPLLESNVLKLDDNRYMLSLKTALSEKYFNLEVDATSFSEDVIYFEYNHKKYQYQIPFNIAVYRLDTKSWQSIRQDLWIDDVAQASVLDLYGNYTNELCVYSSEGKPLCETIRLKDKGIYQQVAIGFLQSYKASYDYYMLLFMQDSVRKQVIFCYNRCMLNVKETELIFNPFNKVLEVLSVYYGKGKVFLSIFDSNEYQVYKSEYLESGNLISVVGLKSFEEYKICYFEKPKGLLKNKERCIKKYAKTFYAWDDFIGHNFKISKVYYDQYVNAELLRKEYNSYKSYIRVLCKESDYVYRADVFNRTTRGDYWLKQINPVSVEICSEILDNTLEISITKDGDGLLLDLEHRSIMNVLDDKMAPDIFSYVLDMKDVE